MRTKAQGTVQGGYSTVVKAANTEKIAIFCTNGKRV